MTVDPQAEHADLLEQLEEEQRTISAARLRLQDRIDYFGGASPDGVAAELIDREREISKRRRELHRQIDALRADRAQPRGER